MTLFLGVDPGANGAAVLITHAQQVVEVLRFKGVIEADISDWFESLGNERSVFAYIEQVHSMPKQGVASSFKFGMSYGFLRGMLIGHRIGFDMVSPSKWQGVMKCRTRGDKNVTRAKASELFPHRKWTHADADAVLIAEYCRCRRGHE